MTWTHRLSRLVELFVLGLAVNLKCRFKRQIMNMGLMLLVVLVLLLLED